jgi:phosphatidylserine/phosphatidylglycerophosphate/cardiolipin synthase-like enzyme
MSNPTARELFPSLATDATTQRQCYVRDGVTSTFVVPGDWVPEAEANLRVQTYSSPILGETQDVWGNDIEFFVGAVEAFPSIWRDVRAALEAPTKSFVCHAGWTCYLETAGFGRRTNYRSMMSALAAGSVLTTTLYWEGSHFAGAEDKAALEEAARALNALTPAGVVRAFIDHETRKFGSHHQKIWVILGPQGVTAYFGGLDVHPNRVDTDENFNHPLHDVHARVRGPAAERLLGIFLWRLIASGEWSQRTMPAPEATSDTMPSDVRPGPGEIVGDLYRSHPSELYERTRAIYRLWSAYRSRGDAQRRSTAQNPVRVCVGHTIGNPHLESAGFRSEIGGMVYNGIVQARRFVYLEDQYFWHMPMARLLGNRIREGHLKQLIIVTNLSDGLAEHPPHTRLALQHLAYAARGHTDKILVFERVGAHGRYVHAKMFVFDDVSALVGSANFNNRGYSHDSESAGVWIDRVSSHTPWDVVESTLARKLRAKLWESHLNVPARHLFDGLGASSFWYEVAAQTAPERLSAGVGVTNVREVTIEVSSERSATESLGTGIAGLRNGVRGIDNVPWSRWAPQQGASEPPGDVHVSEGVEEGADWAIDPDA